MNLTFNAAHQQVLELLKEQGIRYLVDDQYDTLCEHYLQLWLPEPLTEAEVKQLARFHKKHQALTRDENSAWQTVKEALPLEFSDKAVYSETKATLVSLTLVDRMTFESAWKERTPVVCQSINLNVISHLCDTLPAVDAETQAIAESFVRFSDRWIKTLAALELFQVRYLVCNNDVRKRSTKIRDADPLQIWSDPAGDNPAQARKANGRVTGNPGGVAFYKGKSVAQWGEIRWTAGMFGRDFDEHYQRRVCVNVDGVVITLMHPQDRPQ